MQISQKFKELFAIGEIVESGAEPRRKSAADLEIIGRDENFVRYRSMKSKLQERTRYSYLQILWDDFDSLDPRHVQDSVNAALKRAQFKSDYSTENYAYTLIRAFHARMKDLPADAGLSTDSKLPSTTQGFQTSPAVRKAVEDHAMRLAGELFESKGYAVEIRGKPFDLLCKRDDKTVYVEVKGTQGLGTEILLTKGEVSFHRGHSAQMALVVVSQISVSTEGTASGGMLSVQSPWTLDEGRLTPYAFSYRV